MWRYRKERRAINGGGDESGSQVESVECTGGFQGCDRGWDGVADGFQAVLPSLPSHLSVGGDVVALFLCRSLKGEIRVALLPPFSASTSLLLFSPSLFPTFPFLPSCSLCVRGTREKGDWQINFPHRRPFL